jgi:hypothetical protein
MALSMDLWQINNNQLEPMNKIALNLEKRLKKWVFDDISVLGLDLLIIGQEVHTSYGGFVDILAIDEEGNLVIIELKKDKTPRDIVAQCLDYGTWVKKLNYDDIIELYKNYKHSDLGKDYEGYYDKELPNEVNNNYQIIIVAESLDDSTERIVDHLNNDYGVNINVIFFNIFSKNGLEFIGRSWLKDPEDIKEKNPRKRKENWTGYYFVNTGIHDENKSRNWQNNIKYNYISAGGGNRWINAIKRLNKNDKIFAYIKKVGYVGYGIVEEEAVIVKEYYIDNVKMIDELPQNHTWKDIKDPSKDEWIVKVNWVKTFSEDNAKWFKGAFANQNVVSKLRDKKTFDYLVKEFEIDKEEL